MTITLDITPEVRAELARQAAAQGCALEDYAASLLEDAAHLQRDPVHKSLREVFESVRGLADDIDFSRDRSVTPPVDLS
jgi:hypothetical protein